MKDDPPECSENELNRDFSTMLLLEKLLRESYSNAQSKDIQALQWSILRYLNDTAPNRRTVRWISSFLCLTHAPIVRCIATLLNKGLVEQRRNPMDARSNIISLTSKGQRVLQEDPLLRIAARINQLPYNDRSHFRRISRKIALIQDQAEGK
ncbi:MarR family transcriptional regulator [Shimia sp. R10_1]|nr:MarR family transcriptional regulator [Shimia sp. R10_1]